MVALKIIAISLAVLIVSCYLVTLISLGVERGLKNYFENKTSKEE